MACRRAFDAIDEDRGGSLSAAELRSALDSLAVRGASGEAADHKSARARAPASCGIALAKAAARAVARAANKQNGGMRMRMRVR